MPARRYNFLRKEWGQQLHREHRSKKGRKKRKGYDTLNKFRMKHKLERLKEKECYAQIYDLPVST